MLQEVLDKFLLSSHRLERAPGTVQLNPRRALPFSPSQNQLHRFSRLSLLLLYFFVPIFFFMGCSESSPEPEKYKKKLRSFLVTKVKSLDPAKASDRSSSLIVNQIFEGLYHFKYRTRPYVIEPNLAEGLPKISSDRKIYTIRLKKGIHFQDSTYFPEGKGPEITAQDWIDSWKRLGDPKIQSPGTWIFASRIKGFADWQKKVTSDPSQLSQPIFGFKALDRYTLQIELNQPFSPFLSLLTTPFSMVVPNLIINKIGNQKFSENPIGTGPFLLKLWRRGSEIVLHKNPNYRKIYLPGKEAIVNKEKYRLPLLDEVSFRIFLEDQPLWLSFLKSELHISAVPVGLLKKKNNQYQAPEDLSKNDFSLQAEPKEDLSYIGFNMNHPILGTNINLRKAMAHAYNSAAALKVLYNSRGTQAFGPVPPQLMNQGYSYSTRYPYDLAKAKAFIEKAGHPLGKDLPIFNFEIPGQSQNLRKVAEFFKIQMAAIGVQIRLQPNSWPQFEKKVKNRKADIFAMGWYADYPEAENFLQLFYSPNQSPGPNMTNYKNLKYDQLYKQANSSSSEKVKFQIYEQMISMILDDCPMIFNIHTDFVRISRKEVKNYFENNIVSDFYKYLDLDIHGRTKK